MLLWGALASVSWGCAHRPAAETSVDELNRRIQALQVQNASYRRQVEELENRVFILTDQMESREVNAEKVATPELPTVTLRPEEKTPSSQSSGEGSWDDGSGAPLVEYAGEAAKSSDKRPVLRLYGDETPVLSMREDPKPMKVTGEVSRPERRAPPPRSDPVDLYRRAYEALQAGRHAEAVSGFQEFLRAHGSHELADNAQYWLGECHYDRKDYPVALREFRRVVERHPHGNKVPDALLKAGFTYLALGSVESGRHTLQQLVRSYPRHQAAALAASRLSELASPAASPAGEGAARGPKGESRSGRPVEEVP